MYTLKLSNTLSWKSIHWANNFFIDGKKRWFLYLFLVQNCHTKKYEHKYFTNHFFKYNCYYSFVILNIILTWWDILRRMALCYQDVTRAFVIQCVCYVCIFFKNLKFWQYSLIPKTLNMVWIRYQNVSSIHLWTKKWLRKSSKHYIIKVKEPQNV